jgi:hypothetical protein
MGVVASSFDAALRELFLVGGAEGFQAMIVCGGVEAGPADARRTSEAETDTGNAMSETQPLPIDRLVAALFRTGHFFFLALALALAFGFGLALGFAATIAAWISFADAKLMVLNPRW